MSSSICRLFLGLIGASTLHPQPALGQGMNNGCSIQELFNARGWTVPGLADAKTKVSGAKVKQDGIASDITIDILEPTRAEGSITLVTCLPEHPGRVEVRTQPVTVTNIWALKRYGRTFAFRMNAGLSGGNGVALGTAEVLLFYDPDGSGKFTVQRDVAGVQPLFVPEWVSALRSP